MSGLDKDYDDVLAAKDKEIKTLNAALGIAYKQVEELLAEKRRLKEICSEEHRETKKLRCTILELERLVKKFEERWNYRESVL